MSTSNLSQIANKSEIANSNSEIQYGWAILSQSPVRHHPKREVFDMVLVAVAKSFADLNIKSISAQERDYMVNELTDNIILRYPAIRISEIPEAIAQGIRGKYGEFYGLSVVAFERFIAQYLQSDERVRAVKARPEPIVPKRIPDKAEQFALAKSNALMALERKKAGKPISNMASSVYDFLDKLQLLQFSRDEKYDMMADAAREIAAGLRNKLLTAPGHERLALRRDIEAYTDAITGGPLSGLQKQNVIRLSKCLALDAFLNQVILEEFDLEEMMEEKVKG
ncbi:MAG: hypothetical protein ACXVB0_18285 [Mucilaginibacter sp.]